MEFNINSNVKVRLTTHGRAVHRIDYDKLCSSIPAMANFDYELPTEDADGWSTWQLWCLMAEFGAHTGNGKPVCFETVIRLLD